MPIPKHTNGGVLPPFIGDEPGRERADQAPYRVTIEEVVARFGTSAKRRAILRGFIAHRQALRRVDLAQGIQWVDGSFIDVMAREPNDLDVLVLVQAGPTWTNGEPPEAHATEAFQVTDRETAKEMFLCDVLIVDLSEAPVQLARGIAYWYGLFSHQRESFTWRGILELEIVSDDDDAGAVGILTMLEQQANEAELAATEPNVTE